MKKAKKENKNPYRFKVLERDKTWGAWTGDFKTEDEAMVWYGEHGFFHESRGNKLALFKNSKIVREMNACE